MSVPSLFLINSFSSFLLNYDLSSLLLLTPSAFGLFNYKKLPSVKPKLNSAIVVE